ncbi:MAG: PP2C family serine/threonine-protein phosphatase [Granulosicoccus sp.]
MSWTAVQYTDKGQVRSLNEDSVLDHGQQHLWVVADGMGGHEAGDYASQHVVSSLSRYQQHAKPGVSMSRLRELMTISNTHLVEKAETENLGTVGCTVAALNIASLDIMCSWSGDSRIYRLRAGNLRQLTRDHNYGALLEDRNRVQFPHASEEDSELLTAAIGGEALMHLEHCWFSLQPSDKFLLCTDGLYKEMEDAEIESILNEEHDPDLIVNSLADLYRQRGARDNVGIMYVYAGV